MIGTVSFQTLHSKWKCPSRVINALATGRLYVPPILHWENIINSQPLTPHALQIVQILPFLTTGFSFFFNACMNGSQSLQWLVSKLTLSVIDYYVQVLNHGIPRSLSSEQITLDHDVDIICIEKIIIVITDLKIDTNGEKWYSFWS